MENKEQEDKRFLNEIITKLTNDLGIKKNPKKNNNDLLRVSTKSFWNELPEHIEDVEKFAKKIIDVVNPLNSKCLFRDDYSDTTDKNERTEVTFTERDNDIYLPHRMEEALERVIKIASDNSKLNQIVMPDGGHIDLIDDIDKKGNATFVELKMWANENDTPLYALLESLKNYYLFNDVRFSKTRELFNNKGIEKITKLVILAPQQYYDNFKTEKNKSYDILKELIKAIEKELKHEIKIEFKIINILQNDWEKHMKSIYYKADKTSLREWGNNKKCCLVDFLDHKQYIIDNMKEQLINWNDFT